MVSLTGKGVLEAKTIPEAEQQHGDSHAGGPEVEQFQSLRHPGYYITCHCTCSLHIAILYASYEDEETVHRRLVDRGRGGTMPELEVEKSWH